ncbi:class F sortase [Nocardioides sp. HDW12B]|uniref:class F sortase n=1 Tax=Nocardioides sp. HDW12B TaxID=2714939 RepID=UPI00140B9CCB|nr:class F sortase [Nocardioides sp. HDW12B]QIK66694.1 class F sortase [Nocardioides sp. HDW12B]
MADPAHGRDRGPRRRGRGLLPALAGLALLGGGGYLWFGQSGEAQEAALTEAVAVVDPDAAPGPQAEAVELPDPPAGRVTPSSPRRLAIPALGVDAPVAAVRTDGDVLVPPSDAQTLGWWSEGAEPGARRGSALVTGHTVHSGEGALDQLETLEVGDDIVVSTRRGQVDYRVSDVEVFAKGAVTQQAERLFSQEVPGRLVVVTCEDWDGERYLSNVVVTATPR